MDDIKISQVNVKLEGSLAELWTKIDSKRYDEYLYINNGNPTMYVKLKKVLYGALQAAMLFWKNLTKTLTSQ